jgi:hypothetical protein
MEVTTSLETSQESLAEVPSARTESGKTPAWELVEAGRYRPRRIRGSLLGRELG